MISRVKSGNFGHQVNSDSDLVCFLFQLLEQKQSETTDASHLDFHCYAPILCAYIEEGAGELDPLINHKSIGFPGSNDPDLLKITKLPSPHSMWAIIGKPAKRFAGRPIIARF